MDLLIIGSSVNGLPEGVVTYNGTNLLAVGDGSENFYHGEFLIEVDFGNGVGEIMYARTEMSELNSRISNLSGNFTVDSKTGNFTGEELDLVIYSLNRTSNRKEFKATIYGAFHGNDAVGMSGLYHNKSDSPLYVGAIVGAQSKVR